MFSTDNLEDHIDCSNSSRKMTKVLVTDARVNTCLSVIRSLGKKGLDVYCGTDKHAIEGYRESKNLAAISSFSRYGKHIFYYPDPIDQEAFEYYVKRISDKLGIKVIIPVAQRTTYALSKAKTKLKHLVIPLPNFESFNIAWSKKQTLQLASELNIPSPKTTLIDSYSDLANHDFHFPLVVKGVFGSGQVTYVNDMQGLEKSVAAFYQEQGEYPLIQERIYGSGYGFFALFNKGYPRAIFMHKRIREYPATGGMSTCAESVYEAKLLEYGLRLLKALDWHGVAMVEFKKDIQDRQFKIMEINPRFWGSLDLSIASGVDFPYLLYKMAVEGDVKPRFSYRRGLRFAWSFPMDLVRTYEDHAIHLRILPFLSDLIDPRTRRNIRRDDLNPSFMAFTVAINHFCDAALSKVHSM